ncbi:MAG: GntR family transcriptional regulator [Firmicutes bacterium]|nr:GntR family transcriptional regulator [Bacillota bacterium]
MLQINVSSHTPIYQQVIDQIKEQVLLGVLAPGDKLPSVRELATTLTINPNTIQKAYQELERQKVIVTVRGRGNYIAEQSENKLNAEQLETLQEHFRKGIIDALHLGMSPAEVKKLVERLINELHSSGRNENVKS